MRSDQLEITVSLNSQFYGSRPTFTWRTSHVVHENLSIVVIVVLLDALQPKAILNFIVAEIPSELASNYLRKVPSIKLRT